MDLKGCKHFMQCEFEPFRPPECLVGVSLPNTMVFDHESTKICRLDVYAYNSLPVSSKCLLREEFTDEDRALEHERAMMAEVKYEIDRKIWASVIRDAARNVDMDLGEVKCLYCGGRLIWRRSNYNRHLSAACEGNCFFCME